MEHVVPFGQAYAKRLERVNQALDTTVTTWRQEVAKQADPYVRAALESYLTLLLRGSKRLRGVLTLVGYEMYEGKKIEPASIAAAAIEACHAYLLVVDDVADNATTRRGGPAAHYALQTFFTENGVPTLPPDRKAADMAEVAALFGQHKAQTQLATLPNIPAEQKLTALAILNEGLARTGIGQLRDMSPIDAGTLSTEALLQIATYKTAYYTFLLPLQLGGVLAGASTHDVDILKPFAMHAGLAFQLQDDIIGMFGSETDTGKSCKSDITEAKKTVLLTKALQNASAEDQKILLRSFGDPALSDADFKTCLEIIQRSGAFAYTHRIAVEHAEKSLDILQATKGNWPHTTVTFLCQLALYGVKRKS